MQSILEELYYGNIRPDSRIYGQDSPFVQAARVKRDNWDKLMATLNDSQKEVLEKYCEAKADMEGITHYDTFTYALRLGILLMVEVFMGSGEITGDSGARDNG